MNKQQKLNALQNKFKGCMTSNGDKWVHAAVTDSGSVLIITGTGGRSERAFGITETGVHELNDASIHFLLM